MKSRNYLPIIIVIRSGKIVWNTGRFVDIFVGTLNIRGGRAENISKQQKRWLLLSQNEFELFLASFCYNDYGGNAPEAVKKIVTDQKDHRKCSSCVIVC